jgi:hypothetical protein
MASVEDRTSSTPHTGKLPPCQYRRLPPNAANLLLMLQPLLRNRHPELGNDEMGVTQTPPHKKVGDPPSKLGEFELRPERAEVCGTVNPDARRRAVDCRTKNRKLAGATGEPFLKSVRLFQALFGVCQPSNSHDSCSPCDSPGSFSNNQDDELESPPRSLVTARVPEINRRASVNVTEVRAKLYNKPTKICQ